MSEVQGPLNVASGESIQIRELVRVFAERLDGLDLVRFGARPLQGYEVPEVVADTAKLNETLGFTPSVPMDLGVDRTIAWWRQELRKAGEL